MIGMQGGESTFTAGQSSRWKKNSTSSSNGRRSDYYCKRAKRVLLEPVLEHAELVICSNNIKNSSCSSSNGAPGALGCESIKSSSSSYGCQTAVVLQQSYCSNMRKADGGLRILSKLRDGYVKLMNDVAMGADLAGVSSFYGAPPAAAAGYGCPAVAAVAVDHSPVIGTSPRPAPSL